MGYLSWITSCCCFSNSLPKENNDISTIKEPSPLVKENLVEKLDSLITITSKDVEYFSLNGIKTQGKIVDIYDGDTCTIIFYYKNEFMKLKCRLNGIDCPEMRPPKSKVGREEEIKQAILARNKVISMGTSLGELPDIIPKDALKERMNSNTKIITIHLYDFDKYGRVLAELIVDDISINEYLVENKYAKKYDGGTKDEFTYG